MEAFYRIYPGADQDRPFFCGDKLALVYACLISFMESCIVAKQRPVLTFLLDGCPQRWLDMIDELTSLYDFGNVGILALDKEHSGNQASFRYQLDLALQSEEEIIYFAEDDYLYTPGAVAEMYRFAGLSNQFWTPYDHPDRYVRDDDRGGGLTHVKVCGERHWRQVESVCMTFGGKKKLFIETEQLLRDHACTGRNLWYPVLDLGHELWSPVPALATHIMDGYLSMCIDWEEILRDVLNKGLGYSPALWLPLDELSGRLMEVLEIWR